MAAQSPVVRTTSAAQDVAGSGHSLTRTAIAFAPALLAAIAAGLAAEWLDFRALRLPILFGVLAGVVASTAMLASASARERIVTALVLGPATWAAAQIVYAVAHVANGSTFDFDAWPWGSQPSQAAGLILAHAVFLGIPTGVVAAVLLEVWRRLRTRGPHG